jgi:predicted DNA-binding transcriptional regulator AlpA
MFVDQTTTPNAFHDVRLIKFAEAAEVLGVSRDTLKRWVRLKQFPAPLHLTPRGIAMFRLRDISHFLDKRRRGRRVKQAPRGAIRYRLARRGKENPAP